MKVRYNPSWSILFLVLGFVALGVGITGLVLTGRFFLGTWIPGAVCVLVGFSYRRRPYFELVPGKLQVPALIGPLVKDYPYGDISRVEVRDKKVWIDGKKTGISRMMAHGEDWAAFEQQVGAAATFE